MARMDISQLGNDARIWIFGISPAVDAAREQEILSKVDAFLQTWSAHNQSITAARDLIEGSFLVVAVDRRSETSGCSIDRMFGLLQQLERGLGISILDPNRIFYRGGDNAVHAVSRSRFAELADAHTLVYDTIAERLGDVRGGSWLRPASASWHTDLLKKTAST